MNADRVIRWSAALAVVSFAVVAAVVSYEHAGAPVREHGESGWTGRLIPEASSSSDERTFPCP